MNFKENLICKLCNKFLHDPVFLPCFCYVCNEHMSSSGNKITCLTCNEEFPKSKRFKSNEFAKKFLNSDLHLTEEQRSTKQSITKMFSEFDCLLEEFKSNQANFEINISERFNEIRNKIDLQREELKKKIDEIALEIIDQTREKEKNLIKDLSLVNSNIINTGVVEELKTSINNFNLKVDETKTFYFKPNLKSEKKIFGFLNLNGIRSKLISCSNDKTIKIWDLDTFECLISLNGHSDRIWKIERLPNNQILSCSSDKSIKLWDIDTGVCLKTFNDDQTVCSIKILTEKTFASNSYTNIKIWNIDDGICIKILNGHSHLILDFLLLPNGSLVSCSGDKTIKVWDIEQGISTKTLNGHILEVICLLLLNNGNLVSGSADKKIKIWDLESGNCVITLIGHFHSILSLQLKQSGELISASEDGTIKIWNLETFICNKTLEGHDYGVTCIRTYLDSQLFSSSIDTKIKLWNLETGTCFKTLNEHIGVVDYLNVI
jgi:WD40 repeat protein